MLLDVSMAWFQLMQPVTVQGKATLTFSQAKGVPLLILIDGS